MMNRLDAAERFELLLGPGAIIAPLEIAEHELDGFEETAGGLGFPDLAEAAAAQPLDELVAGDRLGARLNPDRHETILGGGQPSLVGGSHVFRTADREIRPSASGTAYVN